LFVQIETFEIPPLASSYEGGEEKIPPLIKGRLGGVLKP
jgi:hypothetical protein